MRPTDGASRFRLKARYAAKAVSERNVTPGCCRPSAAAHCFHKAVINLTVVLREPSDGLFTQLGCDMTVQSRPIGICT